MFYSETLPKSPTSPALARQLLDRLADEVAAPVLENARLLVSELVSNAVEHVREEGDIEVRVAVGDGLLRVEVLDPGPGFEPTPRTPGQSKESGWGLHFTDVVAERWAVDRDERARVWFELRNS
jgi:anti-sigma regulatory factor (Ser/Thr protein kinase)